MVVSFSGIDSAGKSTQIDLLTNHMEKEGYVYSVKWSKARATPGVVFLKSIIRRDKKMSYQDRMEYRKEIFQNSKKKKLLLIASLADLCLYWGIYFRILKNKFKENGYLILDRYLWDTYVEIKTDFYGIDFERWLLWKILLNVTPKPDISIILVVPVEISLERDIVKTDLTVENPATIDSRERKIEKINTYLSLVDKKKWDYVIDGTNNVNDIHKKILSFVLRKSDKKKR